MTQLYRPPIAIERGCERGQQRTLEALSRRFDELRADDGALAAACTAGAGRAIMAEVLQCHVFAQPDFAMGGPHGGAPRVDRMAAADSRNPLRLGTRSRHGRRAPREHRFTVGGSGKSVACCHCTVLAYWKFESISLQR